MLLNASRRVRKGQPKNYIPGEDIRPLAAAFLKGEPVDGEVAVITREQAKQADYNLSPNRWVGQVEDVDQRSISEILADLQGIQDEAREIDQVLDKALVSLR